MEKWTDIPGYEGLYSISIDGKVKAYPRTYKSGPHHSVVKYIPEYFPKITLNNSGYLIVSLSKDAVRNLHPIHRLIAITFIPNPSAFPEVNHINGNKTDNNIGNLEWITRSENLKHAHKTGLIIVKHTKGSGNGRSILNEEKVKDIKARISIGQKTGKIAKLYGVKRHVISFIKMNKTWKHVS